MAWWQACLSGAEPVGLPQVVVFGFVHVGTNARVFEHPLTPAEAAGHVRRWQEQAVVRLLESSPEHVERMLKLLESLGTAGNLVTDAQLAAIAIEYEAVLHTADADFVRFQKLRWLNPLTGIGSASLSRDRPS